VRIDLSKQAIIITGAGRGIGREIALMCAEAGADVVLTSRSAGQLEEVAAEIERMKKGSATVIAADLAEAAAVDQIVKPTIEKFGKIDVLVNNAGVNSIGNLVMSKEDNWRQVFELNVFSVFRLTQAVLRHMIRAKYGRVINMSSAAAKIGAAYASSYAASKAAILGFTKSVARETAQVGITVNAICPWHVDTELVREAMAKRAKMFGKTAEEYLEEIKSHSPQKQLVQSREVAGLALYLMSPEARSLTGQSLNVDGGTVMD
jgi:NAD(P)-dependent dehydrogenase (short-subunit alcohol dehydrogenase family)